MAERTYTDADLATAVAQSRSWRGVLRHLGLLATSAGAARSVRRRAELLGLDHSHFTGQRRWNEDDLRAAIAGSRTWMQVLDTLGLARGSGTETIRGHALRLGIDTGHLQHPRSRTRTSEPILTPDLENLSRAGPVLAAAWFTLSGHEVAWPLEPCRYDLAVSSRGATWRVQVKTCWKQRADGWHVSLSTSGHPTGGQHRRTVYTAEEVDCFFVITGDLDCYLIPIAVVAGFTGINLSAYADFKVGVVSLNGTGRSNPPDPSPGRP
ncbi:group I intron-associated PD-(D/E)XK endonuclease [Nocardioides sp.]|uniref:group I intron-associated PD-(D/E)XK endonuclease n=1 Tax=Nocardioides sp. TaxID=35761 RepID=UPI001A3257B6|nr:group I intron-associated PD-(D/E)XK endonuclease [Nocardioides sp.]MBJ7356755.1 hypothetical protein [Nocardioides sp.]